MKNSKLNPLKLSSKVLLIFEDKTVKKNGTADTYIDTTTSTITLTGMGMMLNHSKTQR